MTVPASPGLVVLSSNRLELLRDAVVAWLARQPLAPLDEEILLVQSNAAADWLKLSLATETGLCAATRFELPGRFLWRMYRRVLGDRIHARSALDRDALTWRLMRVLPTLLERPTFEPVARFLDDRDPDRRLQLARRLADLYDQYQVYRGDWLAAWQRGRPMLIGANGAQRPLPDEQRWQAELWRALLDGLGDDERASARPEVHRAFLDALSTGAPPARPLPRRVVLFGASHVSAQSLEALDALASRMQVICAIPDPCRYHWADIVEGRELLATVKRRRPSRGATTLADVPLEAMHQHAHPLLAAWGRQGRDFMQLLDRFDAAASAASKEFPRIDLYDDAIGPTLLDEVQAAIRDLMPLDDHPRRSVAVDDRSVCFSIAHSPQREVEILHDALLERLAGGGLRPRDIVVMVPDIEAFAPAIRAIFGQYERDDARHIPFDIADLANRGSNALVAGLEWLLRLPDQRLRLRELRDLLEVPAAAMRAGIDLATLPLLFDWLAAAGVRWGLDGEHRNRLGLGAAGSQNTWSFGLRRMLMGYAVGAAVGTKDDAAAGATFAGIEPYDEIGGLEASVVGSLSALIDRLDRWLATTRDDASPIAWAGRARALLDDFFEPVDERERLTLTAMQDALSRWLEACELGGFAEPVPLSVMRESWLDGLEGLDAKRRFLGGGVTFCTLLPLRAVPFEVVCLLGMNDGDFPRAPARNDFDLMALAGQERAGDRSRRDDDRYLMLEALLSARRALHVSWRGRNIRDDSEEPPSVLVTQLRDYLEAGWRAADGRSLLSQLTTRHPLQPFSRRYFDGELVTYAREWQAAHRAGSSVVVREAPGLPDVETQPLTIAALDRFLRRPAGLFFAERLGVVAPRASETSDDDEVFAFAGLDSHSLCRHLLQSPEEVLVAGVDVVLERRIARLTAAGELPLFDLGQRAAAAAAAIARPILEQWAACRLRHPLDVPDVAVHCEIDGFVIADRFDALVSDGGTTSWIDVTPSKLTKNKAPRSDLLLRAWLRASIAAAARAPVGGLSIGCDVVLSIAPPSFDEASLALTAIVRAWRDALQSPLPFALKTALTWLQDPHEARQVYDGTFREPQGERDDFALGRAFPDFDALVADGRFERLARSLAEPIARWVDRSVSVVGKTSALDR